MNKGAIILAGGQSRRMGTNKALLKLGNQTVIEHIHEALEPLFTEMILVTNEPEEYSFLNIQMTSDHYPGKGPLAGLHAGLQKAKYDHNFVIACDMPFVNKEVITSMFAQSSESDAVVPKYQESMHPLFAIYNRSVLPKVKECLEKDQLRMRDLLDRIRVHYYRNDSNPFTFFNMNQKEEYKQAKKWYENK